MTLKTRFKNETMPMHTLLEQQYPFNSLINTENIEKSSADAITCFKLMFLPFLNIKKDEHKFYKESFEILSKYKPELKVENIELSPKENLLHLEYLFLGSRMGNQILINKNPGINEVEYAKYFQLPMPRDLWTEFIEKLDSQSPEYHDLLVQRAKDSFRELINYGKLLEPI